MTAILGIVGAARGLWGWIARQDLRDLVLAGLLGAVAVMAMNLADARSDAERWEVNAAAKQARLARICTAVATAGGDKRLDCDRIEQQLGLFGTAIRDLTAALERQTRAVRALGETTRRDRAALAIARKQAAGRADRAGAASARLEASARAGGPPCEPSAALREAWR